MNFAWKFMLPLALANILAAGVWRFLGVGWERWPVCGALVGGSYLLLARGYLIEDEGGFRATGRPQTREIFEAWPDLPGLRHAGAVERLAEALRRPQPSRTDELTTLFRLSAPEGPSTDWVATRRHIEIGRRLLLLVARATKGVVPENASLVAVFRKIPVELISHVRFDESSRLLVFRLVSCKGRCLTRVYDVAAVRDESTDELHLLSHRTRNRAVVLSRDLPGFRVERIAAASVDADIHRWLPRSLIEYSQRSNVKECHS